MLHRHVIIILIFTLFWANPTRAASLYVEKTGDDLAGENDCQSQDDSPCQTIAQALSLANEGDTIHIGSGDFEESEGLIITVPLTLVGTDSKHTRISTDSEDLAIFDIDIPAEFVDPVVEIRNLTINPFTAPSECVQNASLTTTGAVELILSDVEYGFCEGGQLACQLNTTNLGSNQNLGIPFMLVLGLLAFTRCQIRPKNRTAN